MCTDRLERVRNVYHLTLGRGPWVPLGRLAGQVLGSLLPGSVPGWRSIPDAVQEAGHAGQPSLQVLRVAHRPVCHP